MNFEFFINTKKFFDKPYTVFFVAIFISTVSIILSSNLLENLSSVIVITFTIMPLIPLTMKIFEEEEHTFEKLIDLFSNKSILKFYAWLFLGLIVSFSFWYTFLPKNVSDRVFSQQQTQYYNLGYNRYSDSKTNDQYQFNYEKFETVTERCDAKVLNDITAQYHYNIVNCEVIMPDSPENRAYLIYLESNTKFADLIYNTHTGKIFPYKEFLRSVIMLNNIKLLIFIFFTSFIFAAGSLFIIAWNASIIGVYIGENALKYAALYKLSFAPIVSKFGVYIFAFFYSIAQIFFHGMLEFVGFFIAAIAGGVISVAVIKHQLFSKKFNKIALETIAIFMLSAALIIIAAYIETI
jgi:uncharacterized membrane protein SpoIIM required for sporulation